MTGENGSRISAGQNTDPLVVRPCPVCNCQEHLDVRVVKGKVDLAGAELRLASCSECGAVFQPITLINVNLSASYEYMGHDSQSFLTPPLLECRLERILRTLEPYRMNGRLLEIGAGKGELVRRATAAGWEVSATEISRTCCPRLRQVIGSRVYEGELPDANFDEGAFDVIVLMEVLEHLEAPSSYMTAAWKLLRSGGCLFLTTPNFRGISAALWGLDWRVIGDEHLNYFDRRTITRLLASCGFVEISVKTTGFDASFLQSKLRSATGNDAKRKFDSPFDQTVEPNSRTKKVGNAKLRSCDLLIESANLILRLFSIGDSLKVWASKPAS